MRTTNLENRAKKEMAIIDAATECFIKKGFHQTSMRDIAKQAGISLGGIYRYFEGKNDIILKFVEESNKEVKEVIEYLNSAKNFKKAFRYSLHEMRKEMIKYKELNLYVEIFAEALRNDVVMKIMQKEESEKLIIKAVEQAVKDNKITLKMSPRFFVTSIISTVENSIFTEVIDKSFKKKDAKKLIDITLDLMMDEVK